MLRVSNLNGWYGSAHAIQDITLSVQQGEFVLLAGRNGAGKSTTLKCIMGLADMAGSVLFDGQDLAKRPVHARYGLGLAYVPEERRIVPGLSVRDNLILGSLAQPASARAPDAVESMTAMFPVLEKRFEQQADTLSGGEQQMLALARALIAKPKMIMMDEPSEGLMPKLTDELFDRFDAMKKSGLTILLVDQNVSAALAIADRAYIMDAGRIVFAGDARALRDQPEVLAKYCGV